MQHEELPNKYSHALWHLVVILGFPWRSDLHDLELVQEILQWHLPVADFDLLSDFNFGCISKSCFNVSIKTLLLSCKVLHIFGESRR